MGKLAVITGVFLGVLCSIAQAHRPTSVGKKESFGVAEWAQFGECKKKIRTFHEVSETGGGLRIPILSDMGDILKSVGRAGAESKKPDSNASHPKSVDALKGAKLVFEEDWGEGRIDSEKWYLLRKRWGQGNNGVVPENFRVEKDMVFGQSKNVVVCYGHGDEYEGQVVGWQGNRQRVGGVIVSKPFFASGQFEVVMKIGQTDRNSESPDNPSRPIGMIPAIWTYAYRWVSVDKNIAHDFKAETSLYNPHMNRHGWGVNEYWSELDFPEFGKNQKLEVGLYNTFLNANHQSREFPTAVAIDGKYHIFTTVWRTHLLPFEGIRDDQVVKYSGYFWVQDKSISFDRYRGNPLKKLGQNRYALYMGKSATHYIDGVQVGQNTRYVPSMAAQLNIGVWFPEWAGKAPWSESSISIASVKVWQLYDEGDVRGILVEDIDNNMDKQGMPIKK